MNTFLYDNPKSGIIILLITVFWVLPWKVYSLWTASKKNQKGWFIAILVLNTFGILEIIYTFGVAKKKWSDIRKAFRSLFSPKK